MSVHLQREIEKLKKQILSLSAFVDENLLLAMRALDERDVELARQVKERDYTIDNMEVEVEEECLKILALHQPVANDLRFVVSVLKINNDIERVGDQAVNIANKVIILAEMPALKIRVDFTGMFRAAQGMLRQALDAVINMDADLARRICQQDDDVDRMKKEVREQVLMTIRSEPGLSRGYLAILGVARNLERIADLATNISEDVIYIVEGNIVRHQGAEEQ